MKSYYTTQRDDRARFLKDTQEHRMTILQNEGVYRHIRVAKPGTINMSFNVTTFPGYLVFTGDMGSFTFSRLHDMFDFMDIDWNRPVPTIDYSYWEEKAEAVYKHGGTKTYDVERLRYSAVRAFREYEFLEGCRMDAWKCFREDVMEHLSGDDMRDDMERVMSWRIEGKYPFQDFYEYGSFETHNIRFRWACWAIAYTIMCFKKGGDRHVRQAAHDKMVLGGHW